MPAASTPAPARSGDRRARAQAALSLRGVGQSEADEAFSHGKFVTRARTLFYARLAFLTIGLALLTVPAWSATLGIQGAMGFVVYFGMLGYSVANLLVVEHPTVGPRATFFTLCLDLVIIVYLIEATGGLRSPLLATELVVTTIVVILFPKPLAILPPLLTLPVVAKIDMILGRELGFVDLLTLVWYSALNLVVVYVIVYLNQREEAAHRDVVTLERELQNLAVLEERNRLAREIHDGLGASLSSLIIQSEYLESLSAEGSEIRGEIRELKSCAEEAIDELRRSLRMMREDFELVPAVEDYCRTFGERSKLPLQFEKSGVPQPLSNDAQLAIFRVLQESLSNIQKHAQARSIRVRLAFAERHLVLTIADDGVGFDVRSRPRGHYGLVNMNERAARVGGEVEVRSEPGQGTEVRLSIPIGAAWDLARPSAA